MQASHELSGPNVAYLENSDFNSEGRLINRDIPKGLPVVVMIFASWCHHCQVASPAFQNFANKNSGKVFCAAIQSDGSRETEKELFKRIKEIYPDFKGFPDFLLFKNGTMQKKTIKGRDESHLIEFAGQ